MDYTSLQWERGIFSQLDADAIKDQARFGGEWPRPQPFSLRRYDQSSLVASFAPSSNAVSFAHAIWGWTRPPRPQSVPATTFSRPTTFANPDNSICDQFGRLDEVGRMTDDARDQKLAVR